MKFIPGRKKDGKGEWRREGERRWEVPRSWLLPDKSLIEKVAPLWTPVTPGAFLSLQALTNAE